MSIKLITGPSGTVSAASDAAVHAAANVNGILSGCAISFSGNAISIGSGRMLIEGRVVELSASESITVTESGILAVRIDLDVSPYISLITYPSGTSLTHENLMGAGKIYEQQLGTFTFASGTVSAFAQTISSARCNLRTAPEKSRSDLGIYIQSGEPTSPKAGDIWLY